MNTIWLWLITFSVSCIDPYLPPTIPAPHGYLVVDGFANITPEGTHIRLSRTVDVGIPEAPTPPELNALVSIESEDGSKILFEDKGNGIYGADQITLHLGLKYRLHVRTSDAREYISEYVEWKDTPPMDSLDWEIDEKNKGVQFYVTSHDPDNDTRYYQWEYEATWEYHSVYASQYEYVKDPENPNPTYEEAIENIVYNPLLRIYYCWMTEKSTRILISSSTQLTEDIIYQFPFHFVSASAGKMQVGGYSLLVKQYGLSEQEFEYLKAQKEITESLGGLTDPQPFQLLGNLYCANCDEPVLGYFSLRSLQAMRIFVDTGYDLPIWFTLHSKEYEDTIPEDKKCGNFYLTGAAIPSLLETGFLYPVNEPPPPDGLLSFCINCFQPVKCVDCRKRGGTNIKPDFWPY